MLSYLVLTPTNSQRQQRSSQEIKWAAFLHFWSMFFCEWLQSVSIKNQLGAYSTQSRIQSCFWDVAEMCHGTAGGKTSIVWNGCDQLWELLVATKMAGDIVTFCQKYLFFVATNTTGITFWGRLKNNPVTLTKGSFTPVHYHLVHCPTWKLGNTPVMWAWYEIFCWNVNMVHRL